jgi:hypothetical protein
MGIVLHKFYQKIYASYIQDETAYPYKDVFKKHPFELAIFCGECPFIIDDTIDDTSRNGSDGGCQYIIDSKPFETDISQNEVG